MQSFLQTFWPILLPAALGMAAVYLLLPRVRRYPPLWGGVLGGLALVVAGWLLIHTDTALAETVLFYAFSGVAVLGGGLLIRLRNPVHAALSFALVVLSTCGLFLLQAAPFLMAATVIVYAGAIIVTFLFVIMLAQQSGVSSADMRSREPFLATVAGFVLLGALLCVLHRTYDTTALDDLLARAEKAANAQTFGEARTALGGYREFLDAFDPLLDPLLDAEGKRVRRTRTPWGRTAGELEALRDRVEEVRQLVPREGGDPRDLADLQARLLALYKQGVRVRYTQGSLLPDQKLPLSGFSGTPANADLKQRVGEDGTVKELLPARNVSGLGRSLFSDYLLAVEVAGLLLTVATVGAIVIAGRRREELR